MLDPDSQQAKDLRRIYIDQTLGVDKQPPATQPAAPDATSSGSWKF